MHRGVYFIKRFRVYWESLLLVRWGPFRAFTGFVSISNHDELPHLENWMWIRSCLPRPMVGRPYLSLNFPEAPVSGPQLPTSIKTRDQSLFLLIDKREPQQSFTTQQPVATLWWKEKWSKGGWFPDCYVLKALGPLERHKSAMKDIRPFNALERHGKGTGEAPPNEESPLPFYFLPHDWHHVWGCMSLGLYMLRHHAVTLRHKFLIMIIQ